MSARTWWSAKADPTPAEKRDARTSDNPDLPMDDLLDARIDDDGRLSQLGRGNRQRVAERLDPRPADAGAEELDLAVRKLSEGLEAIERQSRSQRSAAAPATRPAEEIEDAAEGRDFVTYSLDRLEARLEALSNRLRQRSGGTTASSGSAQGDRRADPSFAVAPADDLAAQLAESRRLAEAEEARRAVIEAAEKARQAEAAAAQARREAEHVAEEQRRHAEASELKRQSELAEARRQAEIADARRQNEMAEARRQSEIAEARRQAEIADARRQNEVAEARRQAELAEARRQAEVAEARRQAELAEERRRAEAEAAAEERRRQADEAETIRLADLAEARRNAEAAEARHRAEAEEVRRQAEIAAARREAEAAARAERQFSQIEARIDALQSGLDDNQVGPVRQELLELVQQMSEFSRGGRATAGSLDQISTRLDEMEIRINAARNMAGNRLGDIQDKLSGLVDRIDEIEVEIPGFDAIRVNQSAILERFDRMEGLVHRLASPEDLFERIESLKRQMQTSASQREVTRLEEQLLKLAERLDALPADLSDKVTLDRIEEQLGGLASEFTEARRARKTVASEIEGHLSELSAQLRDVADTGRTPDLSGIEERVAKLTAQLADDRRLTSDTLTRMERRIGALGDTIEERETHATTEILQTITHKMNALASAIEAQDSAGARRDVEGLGQRLDQLSSQVVAQAEHLSREQIGPLTERLDELQGQIADLAKRTMDPRALQTQIEGLISRLELLKGRSIDPARLNELFDRVDTAMRALPEERFDRLEQRLAETIVPSERFDRLEKKIAETAAAGASSDRLTRLEKKLDDIGRIFTAGGELLTQEDLTDLRSDIVALRRELRSLPGQGEASLGDLMRTLVRRLDKLPESPATVADLEAQMDRIARLVEGSGQDRVPLAQIEASLRSIEQRLGDTRHSLGARAAIVDEDDEANSVIGATRALSEDVSALKSSTEASERKSRDAIDAVQDTLEAVVKRMAFIEREADAAEEPRAAAARVTRSGEKAEPAPAPTPEPTSEETAADQPPASLLSRLTSRQLLKRATGGRAESFSPEAEEADEASDFPLEPGTDAPLSSALTGAPSSNTEFMSGARKGRLTPSFSGESARQPRAEPQPAVDDDFLAAARRAARAAAKEVSDSDDEAPAEDGTASRSGTGRRVLLVGALAAAIALAALAYFSPQLLPLDSEIAVLPETSAPVDEAETPSAPASDSTPSEMTAAPVEPTEPEMSTAEAPSAPSSALPAEEPEAASASTPADETPTATEPSTETAATPVDATPSATAPAEDSAESSGTDIAAATPTETPAESTTPPAADTQALTLPESIGPARLRDAALAGDTGAAFEVAARYAEGRGVLPDMPTAVAWYARAADAGLAPAQYRLGSIYEKGLGVPKDLAKAQEWYRRAAEAGNVKAMHNLAVLYAEGAGGTPDLERASGLFRQAAEHGVRDSQFNLAILHARGLGVPQDLVEAYKWFGIAASSGDEESAKRRDIIGEALSEEDRTAAEAAIASFQPTPLISEANEVLIPEGGWSDEENSTSVELSTDNELVALVQKLLAENGYDPGPADGLLGQQTIDAISQFQVKTGLPETGQIDNGLVAALQAPST